MDEVVLTPVAEGLVFPDCPRWRGGALWFSDVHDGRVVRMGDDGRLDTVCEVPGRPAGLGWLPDGRLQVVSMTDRRLLRMDGSHLVEVADLSGYFEHDANDMVMDARGRAYIGNFGFDLAAGEEPTATVMVCVEPDGESWVVIEELLFPNGTTITPDGISLIVAESFGQRLSVYDLLPDGSLANPRVFADLRPNVPDGICLDAEGAAWVADPVMNGVMRVLPGGLVTNWISTGDRGAYACELGGPDGDLLFVCTAESSDPDKTRDLRSGRIEVAPVEVPGTGVA